MRPRDIQSPPLRKQGEGNRCVPQAVTIPSSDWGMRVYTESARVIKEAFTGASLVAQW